MLTIPVGNVTAETELSYEYGVRNKKKEEATPPPQDSGKEETPQDKGAEGGGKLSDVSCLSSCSCWIWWVLSRGS